MQKFVERFWAKVQKTPTCWLWTASGSRYGKLKVAGRDVMAHRIAWELSFGHIPHDMQVLHACDQPRCVNPAHLRLGTQAENMIDMYAKGRRHSTRTTDDADEGHIWQFVPDALRSSHA